jgi:hypothetical protein
MTKFIPTGVREMRKLLLAGFLALGLSSPAFAQAQRSSGTAVTGSTTSALAGTLVMKTTGGFLYGVAVTPTAAGYLMIFDQSTVPASGAVTPVICIQVSANVTTTLAYQILPESFGQGITAVFSSTGCFTYTPSAVAFMHGDFK